MIERGPRKIAFVGTSCIGKSTLYRYYKKLFKRDVSVAFVPEAARIYFTANPHVPISERFSVISQREIQALALRLEKQAHMAGAELIICDRSVLDAVAYVRGYGDKKGSKSLLRKVRNWTSTYHTLFLLDPRDIPYAKDKVRKEEPEVRQKNHEAFLEVFAEAQIPYTLLSGTEKERIQKINTVILSSKFFIDFPKHYLLP